MASPIPRGLKQVLQKSPNDIVILSSLRTPVTRAKKGGFKDAYPEELLANVLKATLKANPNLDPALIEEVTIGSVLQELGGAKAGRMAQIHAGYPHTVPFNTINRQCSSGLAAITAVANGIRAGAANVGIGGGMESMTRNYGSRAIPTVLWPELKASHSQDAQDCIMPMGLTSENVAKRYGISRADQDAFAADSHKKASAAQKAGRFDSEIVPVTTNSTLLSIPMLLLKISPFPKTMVSATTSPLRRWLLSSLPSLLMVLAPLVTAPRLVTVPPPLC